MKNLLRKKRWKNFKRNKKAFFSLLAFIILFVVTLFSEFIANDKPIIVIYDGSYYFPTFKFYPETEFGGDLKTEAYYKDAEKRGPGLYFSMPPIYIYVLGSFIGFLYKIIT